MQSHLRLKSLIAFSLFLSLTNAAVQMSRQGCGESKGCLFRPAGCDPMVDCTLGMIFHVTGPNQLSIQLTANSLIPPPPLQYIAIGFSHDSLMGDDYVAECVLSPQSTAFSEPEVFVSYNGEGKSNDRTYLNATEHTILFDKLEGDVVDTRISCQFTMQVVPQMTSKNGRIWNLNHKYYIFGATGPAQPDELNAHDTSQGSHYYPIVSARAINPALIGSKLYELPPPFVEPKIVEKTDEIALTTQSSEGTTIAIVVEQKENETTTVVPVSSASTLLISSFVHFTILSLFVHFY